MWLEAKVSKRILGEHREILDRFECPFNSAPALIASGVCRQVFGPHPPVDRDALVSQWPAEAPAPPAPKYAGELERRNHNEMGDVLKAAGITVPRSKADRHAALLALQET